MQLQLLETKNADKQHLLIQNCAQPSIPQK